ncbi:MAG: hypothetical protein ACE5Z5_12995 [Candidatus Bathyarchaeia archaeon]
MSDVEYMYPYPRRYERPISTAFGFWHAMHGTYREPEYTPVNLADKRRRLEECRKRHNRLYKARRRQFHQSRMRFYAGTTEIKPEEE